MDIDIENIPDNVNVSTITVTCKLPIIFSIKNIAENIQLNKDRVIFVKYGKDYIRELFPIKKKKRKARKNKNAKKKYRNEWKISYLY